MVYFMEENSLEKIEVYCKVGFEQHIHSGLLK